MNYIVKEFQTSNGVTAEVPITLTDPTNQQEAESQFHLILASAAVSNVEVHSAVILTEDGRNVRNECYRHPVVNLPEEQSGEPEGGIIK